MAVTVYDFETNRWFVQYANGTHELCHNRATAELLARNAYADRADLVATTGKALARHLRLQEVVA